MLKEFKDFTMRGNVIDLAIGIIIGGAFGGVINSLVNDVLMPPIGLLLGRVDFSSLYINLSGQAFASLSEAKAAGAPTINYGIFLNSLINFLIVAFAVFLLIRAVNRTQRQLKPETLEPDTKECPYCYSNIPVKASRCPSCTSQL